MRKKIPLSIEVKKVLKLLMYTLLGMLVSLSVYFFIKMSNTAEKGYLLRENQIQQKNLESENRILKQRVLDAQSLGELRSSDTFKEMEEINSPIYVYPKSPISSRR